MAEIAAGINPAFQSENETIADCTVPSTEYAITVRHAQIQYKDVVGALISGSVPTTNVVLKDFSMTVEKGHIYGLLGASGCGKTSILRAMVGQLDLTAGEIRILGHQPKTPGSGIPGTTVGYMPQDLCLLEEFSIRETLSYYGQLGGMTKEEIDVQCDYLVKLLDLPKSSRHVGTLSGGQKRRVSFAVALLHSPPILILDEPTVGVDPLLRESVWEYLTKLVRTNGTTVLITTHYIEEATQAHTVGLMRHGKLMAEQNPLSLIRTLRCNSLEDVLLKLCLLQSTREDAISSVNDMPDISMLPKVNDDDVHSKPSNLMTRMVSPTQRLRALMEKDSITILRHYWFIFLLIALGPFILTLYCASVGKTPVGLHVSVFNQETNCYSKGVFASDLYGSKNISFNCEMPSSLSCRMLWLLEERNITTVYSETEKSAEDDVRRGRSWAAMTFGKNFTTALMARAAYLSLFDVDEQTIDQGSIRISMDQSDRIISLLLQNELIKVLKALLVQVDDNCHNLKHMKDLPFQYKTPVYGSHELSFADFGVPGMVASIMMMSPFTATVSSLLPEKIHGTLERALVVGATMSEVVLSEFIVCLLPVILIIICTVIVPYELFGLTMIGNYWNIFSVTFPLALVGMLLGFVFALICDTITVALLIGTGFYFTCLFAGGILWPVEGASPYIRSICWLLPMTLPTDALRYIANRGWTMAEKASQMSVTCNSLWCLGLVMVIIIILRTKS